MLKKSFNFQRNDMFHTLFNQHKQKSFDSDGKKNEQKIKCDFQFATRKPTDVLIYRRKKNTMVNLLLSIPQILYFPIYPLQIPQ